MREDYTVGDRGKKILMRWVKMMARVKMKLKNAGGYEEVPII